MKQFTRYNLSKILRSGTLPVVVLLLLSALRLAAQNIETVGNQFVTANVVTDEKCGRFWITSGPKAGGTKFLYQTGDLVTSNIVFKISRNGVDNYYCNVPTSGAIAAWRPQVPGKATGAMWKPYDSIYVSPDTLAVIWTNMDGYTVIMRYIPEKPTTIYDSGTDMLIEFEYHLSIYAPYAEIGILLMCDTFNSDANAFSGGGVGGGDRSSIMTNLKYFAAGSPGGVFAQPYDSIPEFYQVGNFLYQLPLNMVLPIHRIRGTSHAGVPLTTPNMLVIGDWKSFRFVGWDPPSAVGSTPFEDCATIVRWDKRTGDGIIRTAFGTNDRSGNNIFHCRDSIRPTKTTSTTTFIDIRTVRVVTQAQKNGPYSPQQFDVEAWVANADDAFSNSPTVRLVTPIQTLPNNTGRVLLDPSTPASYTLQLNPHEVKKVVWRLNVNPNSTDTLVQLSLRYKLGTRPEKAFMNDCNPLISIKGWKDSIPPTPPDTMAPVVQRTGSGLVPTVFWRFRTSDRHPGYKFDTGLDKILTEANDGNNFTLSWAPTPFNRCDTTVTVNMVATVVDTTRPARVVFAVYDCYGNLTRDSAVYAPRPDIFKPEIFHIDSAGAFGGVPCNTRVFSVYLRDSVHQTPAAGDYGFGVIDGLLFNNFKPLEINFDRGGTAIKDYDPSASFRLTVIDSMLNGNATVRFADIAGNADTITFNYCTQPDDKAPKFSVLKIDNQNWKIDGSDTLAWDRGLEAVQVLNNVNANMTLTPPTIVSGQRTTSFNVNVVDNSKDGDITLELQDTYYKSTPEGHADTLRLRFVKIPDVRAPNILFKPVAGFNNALADVEVNDIHYDAGVKYMYDLGLSIVNVASLSPNFRLSMPISFNKADTVTTFRIQVVDTLALSKRDSICIEATDLAGNRSMSCYYYPPIPDKLTPLVTASLDNMRTKLSARVSDLRDYDRGLGTVAIENPVNLDLTSLPPSLRGNTQTTVWANVNDRTQPISGTIVLRDLVATLDPMPPVLAGHETRVPFALPAVHLVLKLPSLVAGGDKINAAVIIANDSLRQAGLPTIPTTVFTSLDVDSVNFTVNYSGGGRYTSCVPNANFRVTAAAVTGGDLALVWMPQTGRTYRNGDTLGVLTFTTQSSTTVDQFNLHLVANTGTVNGGIGRRTAVQKPGDTAISTLSLPSPYFGMSPDTLTYINGTCQSILTGRRKALKPNEITILGLRPQPISLTGNSALELDVSNLPRSGAHVELVNTLGQAVVTVQILPEIVSGDLTRTHIMLPATLPSGVYFLRIVAAESSDWAKVIITE